MSKINKDIDKTIIKEPNSLNPTLPNIILSIEGLDKTFQSSCETLSIIKGLDLRVRRATKVILTGSSGSGKSTVLNIIGSLESATAGSVKIFDGVARDILKMSEREKREYRARFLGFVFQHHYLLSDFSAKENIALPALTCGEKRHVAFRKAEELLEEVGLSSRANHYPNELSGGERQRVAVARALINDPKLILADEPTGSLDPVNAAHISDLLFSMVDAHKKTLIMVTHDERLAVHADVHYELKDGRLECVGRA